MRPIGWVESCFGEKFGTPRQSGIVPEARGRVVFSDEVPSDASRGLEEFSHIWIVFLFDQVKEEEVRWFVRPPRLGWQSEEGCPCHPLTFSAQSNRAFFSRSGISLQRGFGG
jgi:tRNA (Thr-GGU) A37 N-methylase